jgi:hypothetical protein
MDDLPDSETKQSRPEPADADQVANSTEEPIADAVLGNAVPTSAVMHGNLDDARSAHLADSREEAVRTRE